MAYSDMHKTGYTSLCILLFYAKSFYQCQEKPTNEALAVLCRQTAMVVQILFQISECTLNLIVRIWHTCTVLFLIGRKKGCGYNLSKMEMTLNRIEGEGECRSFLQKRGYA